MKTLRRRRTAVVSAILGWGAGAFAGETLPWTVSEPGYEIEVVATDLQLPVAIAFVPEPGDEPDDPFCYVAELYGAIKVVRRDGGVGDYATGLLNFNPTGNFPGSGEKGVGGIVVHPGTGDLYATLVYSTDPNNPNAPFRPKVIRLRSEDGGLTASSIVDVLDMTSAQQGESHQISHVSFGPDGKLYVHNGDGFFAAQALDLDSFLGKILRMDADGKAPADNPFHDAANGIGPRDYVYAYGFRNPFGGVWRASDGMHYTVDNGPSVDRVARVDAGEDYAWAGSDNNMFVRALYNWVPSHAPVAMAVVEPAVFGGSGFPPHKQGVVFVSESGSTWATGRIGNGKRIVAFDIAPGGGSADGPCTFVDYAGTGKATVAGLAAGPDGLYFTDLYKDADYQTPIDRGANLLRVRYVGAADFDVDVFHGPAPLAVRFDPQPTNPPAVAWTWTFGDGGTSTERSPSHVFASEGTYRVELEIERADGSRLVSQSRPIVAENQDGGFLATYFHGNVFCPPAILERVDNTIDFGWGDGSPDPLVPVDTFCARWTGTIVPEFSEVYTFTARTDDGVRLRVNGQTIVDHWFHQAPTDRTGTIALAAGAPAAVELEYFESLGGAEARLFWQSPSQPKEIVPASRVRTPTDVAPTMEIGSQYILDGVPFFVDLGVRCLGPGGAEDSSVALYVDGAVDILGVDPTDADVSTGPGVVEVDFGKMSSGRKGTVRVHLSADAAETPSIALEAIASTSSADRAPGNDAIAVQRTVVDAPVGASATWTVR